MKDENKKRVANYLRLRLHRDPRQHQVHHHRRRRHPLHPTLPSRQTNEKLNENVRTKNH